MLSWDVSYYPSFFDLDPQLEDILPWNDHDYYTIFDPPLSYDSLENSVPRCNTETSSTLDYFTATLEELQGTNWNKMRKFAQQYMIQNWKTKLQLADKIFEFVNPPVDILQPYFEMSAATVGEDLVANEKAETLKPVIEKDENVVDAPEGEAEARVILLKAITPAISEPSSTMTEVGRFIEPRVSLEPFNQVGVEAFHVTKAMAPSEIGNCIEPPIGTEVIDASATPSEAEPRTPPPISPDPIQITIESSPSVQGSISSSEVGSIFEELVGNTGPRNTSADDPGINLRDLYPMNIKLLREEAKCSKSKPGSYDEQELELPSDSEPMWDIDRGSEVLLELEQEASAGITKVGASPTCPITIDCEEASPIIVDNNGGVPIVIKDDDNDDSFEITLPELESDYDADDEMQLEIQPATGDMIIAWRKAKKQWKNVCRVHGLKDQLRVKLFGRQMKVTNKHMETYGQLSTNEGKRLTCFPRSGDNRR
jgi:hypothetical protein